MYCNHTIVAYRVATVKCVFASLSMHKIHTTTCTECQLYHTRYETCMNNHVANLNVESQLSVVVQVTVIFCRG